MITIDHITITSLRVMDVYRTQLHIQYTNADDEVCYHHVGPSYVQAHTGILQDVLEALAEDLYNWAPVTGMAGNSESPATTLGGNPTIDETDDEVPR